MAQSQGHAQPGPGSPESRLDTHQVEILLRVQVFHCERRKHTINKPEGTARPRSQDPPLNLRVDPRTQRSPDSQNWQLGSEARGRTQGPVARTQPQTQRGLPAPLRLAPAQATSRAPGPASSCPQAIGLPRPGHRRSGSEEPGPALQPYLGPGYCPSCPTGSWPGRPLQGSDGRGEAEVRGRESREGGRGGAGPHLVVGQRVELLAAVLHHRGVVQVTQDVALCARGEPLWGQRSRSSGSGRGARTGRPPKKRPLSPWLGHPRQARPLSEPLCPHLENGEMVYNKGTRELSPSRRSGSVPTPQGP